MPHYVKTFQCMNVQTGQRWTYTFTEGNAGMFGASFSIDKGLDYEAALRIINNWNRIASLQNITKHRYWLD